MIKCIYYFQTVKLVVSDTYECCFSMSDKSKGRRSKAVEDSTKRGIRKRRKKTADHVGKPKSSLSKESALGNNKYKQTG